MNFRLNFSQARQRIAFSDLRGLAKYSMLCLVFWTSFLGSCAFAQSAPPASSLSMIGDIVRNPTTNEDVTVLELVLDPNNAVIGVVTSDSAVILTNTSVGDTFFLGDDNDPPQFTEVEVIAVTVDSNSGLVSGVELQEIALLDPDTPPATRTIEVVRELGVDISPPERGDDIPEIIPPTSTAGVIDYVRVGASGGNGRDGGGIRVCIIGCFTIGVDPRRGGDGQQPGDVNRVIASDYNGGEPITSTQNNKPGIRVGAVGGNGGRGGSGYVAVPGAAGGNGGAGGNVTVTNNADVNVSGADSYGLYAYSQSGTAGRGGDSIGLVGNAGSGGLARSGGTVRVDNHGNIETSGNSGHAVRLFSSGGAAGAGGGGWGIVGTSGSGGQGGNGGSLILDNSGVLRTSGNNANGILAQSVGGSGGDTGASGGIVGIGGVGSTGGNAETVEITNSGSITTTGENSKGILAQSIGGGGGSGGGSGGLVALGPDGGAAGDGHNVSVTNQSSGLIQTTGSFSDAINAQSIGGSGGSGGGSGGVVATSGSGGGAGSGKTVSVINHGDLITEGDNSRGIAVESIGGGGGSGSGSGGLVALSGSGGGSGDGGAVNVTNSGGVTTGVLASQGQGSHAIFAQSIGGGGGSGAGSGGLVALGGAGGGAGDGGLVTINNSGVLITQHHDSSGIFSQSIGGGGGSGAGSGGLVALGGDGGGSGDGGDVNVSNSIEGIVNTFGDRSTAIFAQSVGGGGGSGAGTGGIAAVSGAGGGSGSGGVVSASNEGAIRVLGNQSRGIQAQSIGGGGGAGAGAGGLVALSGNGGGAGSGGQVTVTNSGTIATGLEDRSGTSADAIFAQSIGGGGGSSSGSGGAVGVSGGGGGAGVGGSVSVVNSGALNTHYDFSNGIFAESVGGGGGAGLGAGGLLALSGSGGGAADGGDVAVDNRAGGSIQTRGQSSRGIFAQSVGGGGGDGAVAGGVVSISGSSGGAGSGGAVKVTNNALLITQGGRSEGIFAQSVGGGGGSGGVAGGLLALASGGGGGGSGGSVMVDNQADGVIATNGEYSAAIFAQSVGGGGGNGATAGGLVALGGGASQGQGDGGAVTVDNVSSLFTDGANSRGVFAQSIGGGGGNAGVGGGIVGIGGSGGAAGAGGDVRVSNSGLIRTLGESSSALYVQSIGGGGGSAGDSGGVVAVGGSGAGGASTGGHVTVDNLGQLTTQGNDAKGIFAQSVGGGGGTGGTSGGLITVGGSGGQGSNGGQVSVGVGGLIVTKGQDAQGVHAQSIGGGGGDAGSAYSGSAFVGVSVGGKGGNANQGGTVSLEFLSTNQEGVSTPAEIETEGDRSTGVLAQSVGGGGGSGGTAIQVTAGAYGSISTAVGGSGGAGGDGGSVDLLGDGNVTTNGDSASGVVLQSIGGGGGNSGSTVATSVAGGDYGAIGVAIAVGGDGGAAGDGGLVTADVNSQIKTNGETSTGFLAQSVGGGGGNSETTVSVAAAVGGGGAGSLAVAAGGSGGSAGDGGNVDVALEGSVVTTSSQSDAVVIQSIGGGGGNAGTTVAAAVSGSGGLSANMGVSVGGSGATGGDGGLVNVDIGADIDTDGRGSDGIVAQSVGGGGGNGGLTVGFGASLGLSGGSAGGVSLGLGGSGGAGGNGDTVTVDFSGDKVATNGENSTGILAQSVGGGGGNADGSVSVGLTAGTNAGGLAIGLGGGGGAGGDGGNSDDLWAVDLAAAGDVDTKGDNSVAIVAQSIGGGGGNGGFNVSASGSAAASGAAGINVGLGGGGGSAGDGKNVKSDVDSNVSTVGRNSTGVLTQSVGGGGGNAGFNVSLGVNGSGSVAGNITVGLGGTGGAAGDAGQVTAVATGTIDTKGDNAAGFVSQSLGGGGGNGGFNVNVNAAGSASGSGAIAVGLGGSSGSGGDGGNVVAASNNAISTSGNSADGVVAQSIGGGGGNGGFNVSVAATAGVKANAPSGNLSLGLGGKGQGGGNAGDVNLTVQNNVDTLGRNSAGILAQSIGGGGGNGGFNVAVSAAGSFGTSGAIGIGIGGTAEQGGRAGSVNLNASGDVTTGDHLEFDRDQNGLLLDRGDAAASGDFSSAVIAQSIGGGGGNGGFNVSVSGALSLGADNEGSKFGNAGSLNVGVGGRGGAGGDAAAVAIDFDGKVSTAGFGAQGLLAQSVGGGGGNGGFNVAVAASGAATGALTGALGVGGSGDVGGDGGSVVSSFNGDAVTLGNFSNALTAQSVGGGGGSGAFSVSSAINAASGISGALSIGIGGNGTAGGQGGTVSHTIEDGSISTFGVGSNGVVSQSIGGGGGNGGLSINGSVALAQTNAGAIAFGLGGSGGNGGSGGEANSFVNANVFTQGHSSNGVLTQSLGGGGGNGGVNVTGSVTVSQAGTGNVGIGIGGSGGEGGNSSAVTSQMQFADGVGFVSTLGENASAILAQSIAGGGGNGAVNVSGSLTAGSKTSGALTVGVGGMGSDGGNSGEVKLTSNSTVSTRGNNSHGLIAQSVAGGGGTGGVNVGANLLLTPGVEGSLSLAGNVGVGGFGGGGGDANTVELYYAGDLAVALDAVELLPSEIDPVSGAVTPERLVLRQQQGVIVPALLNPETGEEVISADTVERAELGAHGIVAQSIGGGGGTGGTNISGSINLDRALTSTARTLTLGVGGFGGDGGDAGAVEVTVSDDSTIFAAGTSRSGILAQSVGGGGGNGQTNVSGAISSDGPITVGVGGLAADAGKGDRVIVSVESDIQLVGANNDEDGVGAGILAQSVGGGGGVGGLNVNAGITVAKGSSQLIGSVATPSVNVGVGGFGGSGNSSDDVIVDHTGSITTTGSWKYGLLAQSVAGGGGNGATNIGTQLNVAAATAIGGTRDISIVAGVGGNGGEGADAGNVLVVQNGTVSTSGEYSTAIKAQSIGGGGGNGGLNLTANLTQKGSPLSIGVGGSGSGGGHAGTVTVERGNQDTHTGKISTSGYASHGIQASSIGGGGGDAGMNFNLGATLAGNNSLDANVDEDAFAATFVIGGAGDDAGDGAAVSVENNGDIETQDDASHGILSQSIGGGGGNGNFNMAFTYAGADIGQPSKLLQSIRTQLGKGGQNTSADPESSRKNKNLGLSIVLGGALGDGGKGDRSDVIHEGDITTHGNNSYGILSQSIGGGGGNTGNNFAHVEVEGPKLAITVGSEGGVGRNGGDVVLSSDGGITTYGENSYGLLAQSIGGGGGNSSSISVSGKFIRNNSDGAQQSERFGVSVGREGGEGSYGGEVVLDAQGSVSTHGTQAHALFAQSIGGGGGNGGMARIFTKKPPSGVAVGGKGGTGSYGGKVTLESDAEVTTVGDGAFGLLAQSIGGAGGSGGQAFSGGLFDGDHSISVTVGGEGGTGMRGGVVAVTNNGSVSTQGAGSHSLVAQSIGGGGGNGRSVSNIITLPANKPRIRSNASVGGNGGVGGDGGAVTVNNAGTLFTAGDEASGVLAQSIGGGGGMASIVIQSPVAAVSPDSSVTSSLSDTSLTIGGTGGEGGRGGTVRVMNQSLVDGDESMIVTRGNKSHGILAMSIGGGGGQGSSNFTVNRSAVGSEIGPSSLSIGGNGGEGGVGGDVFVTNDSVIDTSGNESHGVFAQSIGGGGGTGGNAVVTEVPIGKVNTAFAGSVGGSGGNGNRAGLVDVTNSGSIVTRGNQSYGVFAQSVGGGGGDAGFAATVTRASLDSLVSPLNLKNIVTQFALGGAGGDGNDGGDVIVTNTGSITTLGSDSTGILAQSIAGGGGNARFGVSTPVVTGATVLFDEIIGVRDGSDGSVGNVSVNNTGNILMMGDNSEAYVTQTINGGGGNKELALRIIDQALPVVDNKENDEQQPDEILRTRLGGTIKLGGSEVSNSSARDSRSSQRGDIVSVGQSSIGLVAQSIGGGGGRSNTDVSIESDTGQTIEIGLELGANNTEGNSGGEMKFARLGDLELDGEGSQAGIIQSVGGGGGYARIVVNEQLNQDIDLASDSGLVEHSKADFQSSSSASISVALGAFEGAGNMGGDVFFDAEGELLTLGDFASGLVFQSIGAGGGQVQLSGIDSVSVSLGGTGGVGGSAGVVNVNNIGSVVTFGELSHGLVLQSIGGGGGLLVGDTVNSDVDFTLNHQNFGDGGAIKLEQIGDVLVTGERGYGVIAQSLGGGGGALNDVFFGSAGGLGSASDVRIDIQGNAAAGGKNGVAVLAQSSGTNGSGSIVFNLDGHLGAEGESSTGLVAESLSGSSSGAASININGDVIASGELSTGLDLNLLGYDSTETISVNVDNLWSTGEGSVALQGLNDAALAGGIDIEIYQGIGVSGLSADGVKLSSRGTNRSGDIELNIAENITVGSDESTAVLIRTSAERLSGDVAIGVSGSVLLEGDNNVAINTSTDSIESAGQTSVLLETGVTAIGDDNVAIQLASHSERGGDIALDIQGDGFLQGDSSRLVDISTGSGGINLNLGNDLQIAGSENVGLALESNGGGSITARILGNARSVGNSNTLVDISSASLGGSVGAISVDFRGDIVATGNNSTAVEIASQAQQTSAPVRVSLGGDLIASGRNSTALSITTDSHSGGNIFVSTASGGRLFAGQNGTVLRLNGSSSGRSIVTLNGPVSTADGLFGDVIVAGRSADSVVNQDSFIGQFDLGSGRNSFVNNGVMAIGPELTAGSPDSVFANNGNLIIGNEFSAQSTSLGGDFSQSAGGVTYVDIDFETRQLDQLLATGESRLNGQVVLNMVNPELIPSGLFSQVLFGGEQGVVDNGIELIAAPSLVANYQLDYSTGTAAELVYNVDFSPSWIDESLTTVGDYINSIQSTGSSPLISEEVLALLFETDRAEFSRYLGSLSADFYAAQQVQHVLANQSFSEKLLSCKRSNGDHRFNAEEACGWFSAGTQDVSLAGTSSPNDIEFKSDYQTLGIQSSIGGHWFAGFALSQERNTSSGNRGLWFASGKNQQLGVSLKYQPNGWKFSNVLSFGKSEIDSVRSGAIVTPFTAKSNRGLSSLSFVSKTSYDFILNKAYLRPSLTLGVAESSLSEFNEDGADALSLRILESSDASTWLTGGIEAGYEYGLANDSVLRMYGGLSYQHYLSGENATAYTLLGSLNNDVDPMISMAGLGQSKVTKELGFDWVFANNATLRMVYQLESADALEVSDAYIKFSYPF